MVKSSGSAFFVGILAGTSLMLFFYTLDNGELGYILTAAIFLFIFLGIPIWQIRQEKREAKCIICGNENVEAYICGECHSRCWEALTQNHN